MRIYNTKDVTYDFKLAKKYDFFIIFEDPAERVNAYLRRPIPREENYVKPELIASIDSFLDDTNACYKNKNLTATRANNLIDGKEVK